MNAMTTSAVWASTIWLGLAASASLVSQLGEMIGGGEVKQLMVDCKLTSSTSGHLRLNQRDSRVRNAKQHPTEELQK